MLILRMTVNSAQNSAQNQRILTSLDDTLRLHYCAILMSLCCFLFNCKSVMHLIEIRHYIIQNFK